MRSRRIRLGLTLVASLTAAVAIAQPTQRTVQAGVNDDKVAERAKTVPITSKPGRKPVSVLSLESADLGPISAGQSLRGLADIEVSVTCTEPMPKCVGKIYAFSPKVEAGLVIGDAPGDTKGPRIGKPVEIVCGQEYPDRNHHCVLVLDETGVVGTACDSCSLNLVISASHPAAKRGHQLVVGADSDTGIKQGKASISAVVTDADPAPPVVEVVRGTEKLVSRVQVVKQDEDVVSTPLATVRVDNLLQGDVVVFSAEAKTDISRLDYNVLHQAQLIVTEQPGADRPSGIIPLVISKNGLITSRNGANCTQGKSYFKTPCPLYRVGAAVLEKSAVENPNSEKNPGAAVPLYFTLVAGFAAEYGKPAKPGDKLSLKSVELVVERYR